MLGVFDVNGDTTDASASESEMPAWAVRSAPQSLAPSPHIPTYSLTHIHTHRHIPLSMTLIIPLFHSNSKLGHKTGEDFTAHEQ